MFFSILLKSGDTKTAAVCIPLPTNGILPPATAPPAKSIYDVSALTIILEPKLTDTERGIKLDALDAS